MTAPREARDELRRLYDAWIEAQVATLSEPIRSRHEPLLAAEMDARLALEIAAIHELPAFLDALDAAEAERGRLLKLIAWCRPRLRREGYGTRLDDMIANPRDVDPDEGVMVQSAALEPTS